MAVAGTTGLVLELGDGPVEEALALPRRGLVEPLVAVAAIADVVAALEQRRQQGRMARRDPRGDEVRTRDIELREQVEQRPDADPRTEAALFELLQAGDRLATIQPQAGGVGVEIERETERAALAVRPPAGFGRLRARGRVVIVALRQGRRGPPPARGPRPGRPARTRTSRAD